MLYMNTAFFVIYGLKTNCSQYAQENPQYLPMNLFNQLSKSRAILMLWLFIYTTRYQVIHKLLAKKYSVRIYPSSNEAKKSTSLTVKRNGLRLQAFSLRAFDFVSFQLLLINTPSAYIIVIQPMDSANDSHNLQPRPNV